MVAAPGKVRTVAVLGAGHGGCAAAADLTARGFDVRLHARREATLVPLREAGGINATGIQDGFFVPQLMTTDVAEAVKGADLIMLVVPSVAHRDYARSLAGLVGPQTPILLNPGHTGGALHFLKELRAAGYAGELPLAETVSLTYVARMVGPATVGIYSYIRNLKFAALPARHADALFSLISPVYPEIVKVGNVLEVALSNMNAVFHPTGMLMNVGWIERTDGNFLFYKEGITEGVGRATQAVDDERMAVAAALDVSSRPFLENFLRAGLTTQEAVATGSIARACEESAPNARIKSPPSLDHRYVHEDVGYGLVPFSAFGRLAGVPTPTIDAFIQIASVASGIDYMRDGLTAEKMGIEGLSRDALLEFVERGEA